MGLTSCCCGCTLRTGSLVIGYVYLVSSVIGVVMSALSVIVLSNQGNGESLSTTDQDPRNYIESALSRVYIIVAIVSTKALIINSLMIHGINKTKPALVLPWIMFQAAGMVTQSMVTFYAVVALATQGTIGMWVGGAFILILGFCFELYILLVVTSHYHKMKKSSLLDEEQIMM